MYVTYMGMYAGRQVYTDVHSRSLIWVLFICTLASFFDRDSRALPVASSPLPIICSVRACVFRSLFFANIRVDVAHRTSKLSAAAFVYIHIYIYVFFSWFLCIIVVHTIALDMCWYLCIYEHILNT